MQARKVFTACFAFMILSWACSNDRNDLGIDLNNGERWSVNDEMKPIIEEGESILRLFLYSKNGDHKTLARQLQSQNGLLIRSCTMEGQGHVELHKWLLPHMDLIDQLEKASSGDRVEQILSELEESFKIYHQYFE